MSVPVDQDFYYYKGHDGSDLSGQAAGAYIFRPTDDQARVSQAGRQAERSDSRTCLMKAWLGGVGVAAACEHGRGQAGGGQGQRRHRGRTDPPTSMTTQASRQASWADRLGGGVWCWQVRQAWSSWLKQTVRLYDDANYAELEWTVRQHHTTAAPCMTTFPPPAQSLTGCIYRVNPCSLP